MVELQRQRVAWTGFPGAPGVSTFYFTDAPGAQGDVTAFFTTIALSTPIDVHFQVEATGDIIDSATGTLTGTWVGTQQVPAIGANVSDYAAPVGACVEWLTAAVRNGHHVRGRTYLVPISRDTFDTDGTLQPNSIAAFLAAALALNGAQVGNLKIWSRPVVARGAWTDKFGKLHAAVAASAGAAFDVVGARVPDKAVVLRSRRD